MLPEYSHQNLLVHALVELKLLLLTRVVKLKVLPKTVMVKAKEL